MDDVGVAGRDFTGEFVVDDHLYARPGGDLIVRVLPFAGKANVHVLQATADQYRIEVVCLGEGCPACEAAFPTELRRGAVAVDLRGPRLGVLVWRMPTPGVTSGRRDPIEDAVLAAVKLGSRAVLRLVRATTGVTRYDVIPGIDLSQADNGEDLLTRCELAYQRGCLRIRLARELTREQMLELPTIQQALALTRALATSKCSPEQRAAIDRLFDDPSNDGAEER
jgi:hypothetical protein